MKTISIVVVYLIKGEEIKIVLRWVSMKNFKKNVSLALIEHDIKGENRRKGREREKIN